MKPALYRRFYISFAYLYGAINSITAFEIVRHYFPDADKIEFLKDLKTRVNKKTTDYRVHEIDDLHYIISDEFYTRHHIDNVFQAQGNKPFFLPSTVDEFFSFNVLNIDRERHRSFHDLTIFINEHMANKEMIEAKIITMYIEEMVRHNRTLEEIHDFLDEREIFLFEEKKEYAAFDLLLLNMSLNTRLVIHRGYTENDINTFLKDKIIDSNYMLSESLENMMLEGTIDADEYLESVIQNDIMTLKDKDVLISKIENIKNQIHLA